MQQSGFTKPQIPVRSSSKNATLEQITGQKRKLEEAAEDMTRNVKLQTSFDWKFWNDLRKAETKRLEANVLQHKISMISMEVDATDAAAVKRWQNTAEGEKCLQQEAALKEKVKALENKANVVANPTNNKEFALRKVFTELFIGSKVGLGLNNLRGKRPGYLQTQFRKELEEKMGIQDPKLPKSGWWCPVRREFCEAMQAGHLFPSKCGEEAMTAIFGEAELDKDMKRPEEGKSELFRAVNGILWSTEAEKRFSQGYFCIVPDLHDNASTAEIQAWQISPVKEYRIRVLSPEADLMNEPLSLTQLNTLWKQIDGRRLDFGDKTFRPRARYLYWSYIEIMLRHSYSEKSKTGMLSAGEVGRRELGKNYWGSAGSYMRRNQLLGFVEAMGHEYEHLLQGAITEQSAPSEPVPETAFLIANESILDKNKTREEREAEEESDDDYDDDGLFD